MEVNQRIKKLKRELESIKKDQKFTEKENRRLNALVRKLKSKLDHFRDVSEIVAEEESSRLWNLNTSFKHSKSFGNVLDNLDTGKAISV